MNRKKYAGITCNEKFMEINTGSFSGWVVDDPEGEDIYLNPLADCETIGKAILKALAKSRDVSISEKDRQALIDGRVTKQWINEKYPELEWTAPAAVAERYEMWVQRMLREYRYKTEKSLMKNMQHVSVEDDWKYMTFIPSNHESVEGHSGDDITDDLNVVIPSNSSVEIIGAAARYVIGNCCGLGADFMRDLLFPNGQPESFEEYLGELNLSV